DVGETWTYQTSYTLTQADLDGKGGGDGKLDNLATATTTEAGSHSATASVPLVYSPAFTITKSATVADGTADKAGDVVNYTITVTNTGNISLTGLAVTDQVESYAGTTVSGPASGDGNGNGVLDVGETWTYTTSYTLTQADLDGKGGGDGKLDNTATASTTEAGSHSATASVPLVYSPAFTIAKTAAVEDGTADRAGDVINFSTTAANTRTISLTGLAVTDQVEAYTGTAVSGPASGDGNGN